MVTQNDGFDLHIKWNSPNTKPYLFTFSTLLIALCIIYGNSLSCGWHFDDFYNIVNNPNVHLKKITLDGLKKAAFGTGLNYDRITDIPSNRPLPFITFALNYFFGGTNVFGYHLVNIFIHYVAAVFLFLFLINTFRLPVLRSRFETIAYPVSLLSIFFWATHPLQVTAVTYIVQRMASMAGTFYIMSFYFYLKGRTADRTGPRTIFFILFGASALFSFSSKPNTALLPLCIFIFDLFLIQGISRETIKKNIKIAVIPLIAVLLLCVYFTDFSILTKGYRIRPFTLDERLLTEPRILLFYVSLLLYPVDSRLTLLHDIDISTSLFLPWSTLPALFAIIITICAAFMFSRKKPLIAFCILFFFINHLVESSFIPLELIFEHRNYIPSMLFFVPIAIFMLFVINYFSYKKNIQMLMAMGFAVIISAHGVSTYLRNGILQNDFTLSYDNISKYPELSRPHNDLGTYYYNNGHYPESVVEFKTALALNNFSNLKLPSVTHENIGMYYFKTREYDLALHHFQTSSDLYEGNPHPRTHIGFAMVYFKQGDMEKALNSIHKAVAISPQNDEYQFLLSMILLKAGHIDAAMSAAYTSLGVNPFYEWPLTVIAEASRKKGEYEKSIQYWESLLKKMPENICARFALVELYSITGQTKKLSHMVGQLLVLKGQKKLIDLINDIKKDDIESYIPDAKILIPVIRENLLYQGINMGS